MRVDGDLQQTAAISAGDTATLDIEPRRDWPEPNVSVLLTGGWYSVCDNEGSCFN
jgi:hypothetical protein